MSRNIIIIPYRNRQTHLDYFLENSYPLLKSVLPNLEIIIVEQSEDKQLFNRGKLLNIGYHYYNETDHIYFNHDVDTNPINNTTLSKYAEPIKKDEFLGLYTSACNTLGGVIKFRGCTFQKINGYPNDYFGWGCEDKALKNRADFYEMTTHRFVINTDPNRNQYFMVFDKHERIMNKSYDLVAKNDYGEFKNLDKTSQLKTILNSGLNTLSYKILENKKIKDDVVKITVSI